MPEPEEESEPLNRACRKEGQRDAGSKRRPPKSGSKPRRLPGKERASWALSWLRWPLKAASPFG